MVVFPAKPGRSESPKKSHILWLLLVLLAGFRRTVSGDSRSKNAVKPAAYWTLLDVSRASIGARRGLALLDQVFNIKFNILNGIFRGPIYGPLQQP
jgi:hypothetical protein